MYYIRVGTRAYVKAYYLRKDVSTCFFADITYFRSDVVLLRLAITVPLSDHVSLACLPQPGDLDVILQQRIKCRVIGWGHTGDGNCVIHSVRA